MTRLFSYVLSMLVTVSALAQQEPLYTQYMFNPLNYNPAYAGSKSILSAAIVHRQQWVGVDGAPQLTTLSAHSPLKNKNMGVGLEFTNDVIGPTDNFWIQATYAYRIKPSKIHKGKIGFGLKVGIYNTQFNWNEITYKDEVDGLVGANTTSHTVPTFDFGIYYHNTNKNFAGLTFTNLGQPKVGLDYDVSVSNQSYNPEQRLNSAIIFTYGHIFELNDRTVFRPSMLARTGLDFNYVVDINMSLLFDAVFWAGVSYRTSNTIALVLEYEITRMIKAGYSYDYDLNPIASGFSGSHEIFIGFSYNVFKSRMRSPRYYF